MFYRFLRGRQALFRVAHHARQGHPGKHHGSHHGGHRVVGSSVGTLAGREGEAALAGFRVTQQITSDVAESNSPELAPEK